MEFNFYIKESNSYKLMHLIPPSGADWTFFKSLRMTVENQLNIIRNDILQFMGKSKEEANLIVPKVDDKEIQKKIDLLVGFRSLNSKTKNDIVALLSEEKFIICENCGYKMYKVPLNVKYQQMGHSYILKELNNHEIIKYIYCCENCIFAISEECYNEKENNKKWRKQLIEDGYGFVPNEFGFWHWIDSTKKKPEQLLEKYDDTPRKRKFERYDIKNETFIKIIEEYTDGRIINIK
jgi:hypothetical protein